MKLHGEYQWGKAKWQLLQVVKLWLHVCAALIPPRHGMLKWPSIIVSACMANKGRPPLWWTKPETKVEAVFTASGSKLKPSTLSLRLQTRLCGLYLSLNYCPGLGATHSIGLPIQVYPMYENALRAHRSQSMQENNTESARLYAEFAKVAEQNPVAWNFGKAAATEETIGTVSKKNRMICYPCTHRIALC